MSKSLGNGLDPLELVDEFGADALKFTLAFMCAQGQDILMDKESVKMGSRFANKIWNAARYILMNLEGRTVVEDPELRPVDKWIFSRLGNAAKAMSQAFNSYRYNDAAQRAYEFFWNDFCDWYVEATKLSLKDGGDAEKDRTATVLLKALAESLRLLHPLLPFVTEEIYGKLPEQVRAELFRAEQVRAEEISSPGWLITSRYPEYSAESDDPEAEEYFGFIQDLVRMTRTLRSECTIPPDKKIKVLARIRDGEKETFLRENAALVKLLAGIGELEIQNGAAEFTRPEGSIAVVGNGFEAFIYIALSADLAALKQKFSKDMEKDGKFIASLTTKLENENFIKNAPPELVAGERAKLAESVKRAEKLAAYIRDLA
jgi:valyl-tRNA synthetase